MTGTGSLGSAGVERGPEARASAEARVERLFAGLSRTDVPVWSGVVRTSGPDALEGARDVAVARAAAAGRGELLELSLERVALAYAHHLGDLGYWTAVFGVPVPLDARDRATSQSVVEDLVTAVVVEDVAPDEVLDTLRADGERMLRWAAADGGPDDSEGHGGAPIDPFGGPLVAATPTRGLVLLAVGSLSYAGALIAAVAAGPFLLLRALSPRRRDLALAVLLGSIAFALVAHVVQDVGLGIVAGLATATVLPASSFGLDWWSRRARSRRRGGRA